MAEQQVNNLLKFITTKNRIHGFYGIHSCFWLSVLLVLLLGQEVQLGLLIQTPGWKDYSNVTLGVRVGGELSGVGDDFLVDTDQLSRDNSLED